MQHDFNFWLKSRREVYDDHCVIKSKRTNHCDHSFDQEDSENSCTATDSMIPATIT